MKKRIKALMLAVCLIAALPSSLRGNDMEAEAAARTVKIWVTHGTTSTAKYGVPTAFIARYNRVTTKVKSYYSARFGININFVKPTTNYVRNGPADTCRFNSVNFNTLCTCRDKATCITTTPHCTNAQHNLDELFSNIPNSGGYFLHITAARLCLAYTNPATNVTSHEEVYGLRGGWAGYDHMIVQDYDYTKTDEYTVTNWLGNSTEITYVAKTIAHEIGHLYGVEDHYNTTYGTDKDSCIWGKYKDVYTVADTLRICSDCSATIYQNRDRFNHSDS
ncbi:MAG: hypothetical protein IJN11_07440 [Oscillospiraceae bacterium]|nr:hypothetical protein [Oscillospiraceae bacterium]